MDRFITSEIVQMVKGLMQSSERKEKMVKLNYNIASRHYSYIELQKNLSGLMASFFGDD
jgi:hypothetical protein